MESQRRSSTGGSSVSREEGHQYKVREDSSLVPADIGLKNAQACIGACFEQFVDEWYKRTNGGFEEVCKQLSQAEPNTDLWTLYCCDSTYCGVWAPVKGKSPSVDLIINKCQK
ncbi:hypothetical protein F4818DRAFT_17427 [Hypoxylon cercidicola]|nr:hypothetical protein F4818DRAFT_17427 [Hypoxylon cercidicola]